ncbi:MAG: tetratricopeptide repeat protein [Alphaproteobacteria bacterium]|nr:tetratricopeptide repeat protein [Alphaproteobacteria bacterium]
MSIAANPQPSSTAPALEAADALSRALKMLRQGEPGQAAALCRDLVERQPGNGQAWYLRGLALRALRDVTGARTCLETAIAQGFAEAVAYFEIARTQVLLGDRAAAEAQYRKALAAQPDLTAASRELASLCLEAGRLDEAEQWFGETLRHDPGDGMARRNLAQLLYRLERGGEAIATLDAGVALAPDQPDLHVMLATLHELENDPPAAQRHSETAIALDPGNPSATVILAKLAFRRGDPGGALTLLDGVDRARMSDQQQVTRHAERGRALDRLGRYEEAFAAYRQSREKLAALQKHMPAQGGATCAARMSVVEAGMNRARFEQLALRDAAPNNIQNDLPRDTPQPIFVLGFMRSGTTLIERILGAHPAIAPMGELTLMVDAADQLTARLSGGFPDGLFALEDGAAREILQAQRQDYLTQVRDRMDDPADDSTAARLFVDKAPFNAEHIGLIRLLFPEAPIIHAVRHPLDVVLSSFFVNFAEPFPWSFSPEAIAALFARTHDHLAALSPDPVGDVLPVRYEQLVEDSETVVRAMLDYVGAEWDAACLDFHQRAGGVRTASYAQVARPLYNSSVYRYRNYLPFIDAAVLDTLRPAVDALGYDYAV